MEDNTTTLYASELPYPPITVSAKNPVYARAMLDNMGGDNSEMSAVSLYLYNQLVTEDKQDLSLAFHKISIVEMRHLKIFGTLARMLGEDPRLWTQHGVKKAYWTPGYNRYPPRLPALLQNSLASEKAAISKYQHQCSQIKDPCIVEILRRIILDEEMHIQIYQKMFATYCTNGANGYADIG